MWPYPSLRKRQRLVDITQNGDNHPVSWFQPSAAVSIRHLSVAAFFQCGVCRFWNECFVPLTLPYVYDTSSFHFTERVASSHTQRRRAGLSRGPRGADQLQVERSRCTVWTVGDDERLVKDELDGGAGAVGIAPWHVVG